MFYMALRDGSDAKLDLSKGMFDAGDTMKFGFPMAFTVTVLSWAILEYGDQMNDVSQLEPARDSLQLITDFLVNAHPSPNVLYIQVGDPDIDHKCCQIPEKMVAQKRPLVQVNTSSPGTEVAAETAAALASASLVFKATDADYSALLLRHAKELFTFADRHRASYSVSIPKCRITIILQDTKMSFYGLLLGFIMQYVVPNAATVYHTYLDRGSNTAQTSSLPLPSFYI